MRIRGIAAIVIAGAALVAAPAAQADTRCHSLVACMKLSQACRRGGGTFEWTKFPDSPGGTYEGSCSLD